MNLVFFVRLWTSSSRRVDVSKVEHWRYRIVRSNFDFTICGSPATTSQMGKLGKRNFPCRLRPNYLQVGRGIIRIDENAVNIGDLDNLQRVNPSFHGYLQKSSEPKYWSSLMHKRGIVYRSKNTVLGISPVGWRMRVLRAEPVLTASGARVKLFS